MLLGSVDVRLGCQGWTETDWRGTFYPADLKDSNRLASYAGAFDFVEIDSTFYATPAPGVVARWDESTPENFRFASKVPQAITHDPDPKTKLPRTPLQGEGWQDQLERYVDTMGILGDKLLVAVAQLPPQWHWKPERLPVLREFLESLPGEMNWAMEFRHRGWLNEEALGLLREYRVSLVMQDLYYMPRDIEVTTPDLAYIRLLGRRKEITRMDEVQIERDEALDYWASVVDELIRRDVRTIIVTANNHYQGFAPGTLVGLQQRIGMPVSVAPAQRSGQLPLE